MISGFALNKKRIMELVRGVVDSRVFLFLFYIFLFLFIFSFNFILVKDPDFGWHMRYGEEIIKSHKIALTDTFSHSFYGKPFVDYEWLTEVIYYLVFTKYSFFGISLFSAVITSVSFFLLVFLFKGGIFEKFLVTAISVFGSSSVLEVGARPQNISLVFFSLISILILKSRETKKIRYLFIIPPLFILWANTHPAFYLGLTLILIYAVLDFFLLLRYSLFRKLNINKSKSFLVFITIFSVSVFFSQIRPRSITGTGGFSLELIKSLALPLNLALSTTQSGSVRTSIMEWLPPVFKDLGGLIFLLTIVISSLFFIDKKLKQKDLFNLVIILAFGYFSTLSRRNVPYFFLVLIPIFLEYVHISVWLLQKKVAVYLLDIFIVFLLTMIVLLKLPAETEKIISGGRSISSYCETVGFPCRAIDYVRTNKMKGKMFNFYSWGGFLIWQLPQYPSFIDGRIPSGEIFNDFDKVSKLKEGWQQVLDKYNIGWMIMPHNTIFEYTLQEVDKWKLAYSDDKAVIMVKD